MDKKELIATINEALAEEFEVDISDIKPDAIIKDILHLDSLSLVDMVALIEATFQVKIKGTDVGKILTFEALYDFIDNRIKA
jgi:acyl carrier protein